MLDKRLDDLIEIIEYIEKKQHILTEMLIHLGCRADIYDEYISACFQELGSLKEPAFKELK